ncbi:MAG: hypothetical protein H6767_05960 [Candidatus Peribacteria bacterium]|nr:MAG: hypothetical protein H6767_05960 [Candidatus Peribacteria bacterium]
MGRMCQAMEQLAHSQAQLANDNAGKTTAEIRQLQHETKSNYMIAL